MWKHNTAFWTGFWDGLTLGPVWRYLRRILAR